MISDEQFMQRCIYLATLGKGNVAPNPLVGAVIVYQGKIIGEGYHQKYGEAHAEVNAVNSVEDQSLLSESTIYVSLEPCAHHGKTPPCADLLVKHKFKRVVIGCTDSFDKVSGKGVEKLRNAGIDVEIGVLKKECRELNKHFFTFHEKKRPFVFLKWAQTTNGLIDSTGLNPGGVTWISVPEVRTLVHQWRSEHMAIMVGRKTVENDNPSLTVREVEGKNPIRIVLDPNGKIPASAKVFNDEAKTLIITQRMETDDLLSFLYKKDIQSVLIEGGAQTLQSFIDANLWDEACQIIGQNEFESGTQAPIIKGDFRSETHFGDTLNFYRNA